MLLYRTQRIDLKTMAGWFPAEFTTDLVSELGDLHVGELDEASGAHADHVVSGFEPVDQPVVGLLGIKECLRNDSSFNQKADRSIDRGLGDPVI